MKGMLIAIFSFFFIFFLSAQSYHPFAIQGANWHVTDQWSLSEPPANETEFTRDNYCYTINGDTLINEILYQKLFENANGGLFAQVIGLIREDTVNRKVYMIKTNVTRNPNPGWCNSDIQDSLLFDFSTGTRDSIYVISGYFQSCSAGNFAVDSVQRVFIYGANRTVWYINASGYHGTSNFSLIEGVGYSFGLFGTPISDYYDFGFISDLIDHCDSSCSSCDTVTAVMPELKSDLDVRLFPNPAYNECALKVEGPNQMSSAYIYDAVGRHVMKLFNNQQLSAFSFNCNSLSSGLYFIRVSYENGTIEVKKLVVQH